jgi:ankyrin repeat protein
MKHFILVFGFILVFQVHYGYADADDNFAKELAKNDFTRMERLLQRGRVSVNSFIGLILYRPEGFRGFNRNNVVRVLELLIKYGADVNFIDDTTPLQKAITWGLGGAWSPEQLMDIIQCLLRNGANVNSRKDTSRETPLMIASYKNNINIAKLLIEKGADVNATRKAEYGWPTALTNVLYGIQQTRETNFDLVKLLIENGADPNLGVLSLPESYDIGNRELINYLREHGAAYNQKLWDKIWDANPIAAENEFKGKAVSFFGQVKTIDIFEGNHYISLSAPFKFSNNAASMALMAMAGSNFIVASFAEDHTNDLLGLQIDKSCIVKGIVSGRHFIENACLSQ